jgi:glycosyltransferase involved in cell wall biosynthesis
MKKDENNVSHAAAPAAARTGKDKVLIAIPTFRRPDGLRSVLKAIEKLETSADIRVLVADNEGRGDGFRVVAELEPTYRFPLAVIPVPERGLTNVRNAMIAFARRIADLDYIAMIDDDERPSPGWVDALIAMQKRTGCEIVGGPTVPVFAAEAPEWARGCYLFTSGDFPDGVIDMTWGTCNVLFHRKVLDMSPAEIFDPMFNALGGEDVDAFMRLKTLGCRYAWARLAVVLDDIPLRRTTFKWITQRAFRIGNSNMAAQRRWQAGMSNWFVALPVAMVRIILHSLLLIAYSMSPKKRLNQYCKWLRSLGGLALLLNIRFVEY